MSAGGSKVRDARLRADTRRGLEFWAVVVAVVAIAVVLVLRRHDANRVLFAEPDAGGIFSSDGEGLMDGRRALRPVVNDWRPIDDRYLVALVGPGSAVLRHEELQLDEDAPVVWIRQVGTTDEVPVAGERGLRWHGWVARQPRDYGTGSDTSDLPWRSATGRGVRVRPGEIVRLRTRYDVPRSSARDCRIEILPEGQSWEVRRDGGGPDDWKTLRMRDRVSSDETREVVVRTGQVGLLAFRVGRPGCRPSSFSEVSPDGD